MWLAQSMHPGTIYLILFRLLESERIKYKEAEKLGGALCEVVKMGSGDGWSLDHDSCFGAACRSVAGVNGFSVLPNRCISLLSLEILRWGRALKIVGVQNALRIRF